ncbi:MAG: hypothetical protein WCA85_04605 [Paraburkholderia sp.]|uniref:hypothetical protein n=1 Tax=Paraburkholderia sp. TaxID=1926495 RepID=UPI003C67AA95
MTSSADLLVFTATSPARTKVGRLRELFNQIEQAQARGWRQENIVEALRGQSLELSVDYLKNALGRIRSERKQDSTASTTRPAGIAPKNKASATGGTPVQTSPGPTAVRPASVFSEDGFRDPPPTFTRDIRKRINLDE